MQTVMETRGDQMLALRRARMAASPAFLRGGFRPFFLGGAAWAVGALTLWLLSLTSVLVLPTAFDPLAWHRHEMLFGFVGAVVAGFLLTAIPNWTGRLPIAGLPLAGLFSLWLAGRFALLFSLSIGILPAAILDAGFYLVLAGFAAREVLEGKNRNLPIVGLVFLFGLANAFDYLAASGVVDDTSLPWKTALSLVIIMISLIGGRIIPSFTRNWLMKRGIRESLPGQPDRFDLIAIGVTALALFTWLLAPAGKFPASVLMVAAALQFLRLIRWKGWKTLADPLVLILHVGFLWVPVGLGLLALSQVNAIVPQSVAVHALTAGAMATMILAVMTRATLGHTGRELRAGPATSLIYIFVTAGAVLRVAAGFGAMEYRVGLEVAGGLWMSAFVLFLIVYGPILARPRQGEQI